MQHVTVEFTSKFHEPIVFGGRPPTREEPITFAIDASAITAVLFTDDADDYMMTHVDGVPLVSDGSTACTAIRLSLQISAPDEVAADLRAGARTVATEDWGKGLLAAFDRVMSAVVDYARNVKKQFWIERFEVDPYASVDELLRRLKARIIIDGYARELSLSPGISMTIGLPRRGNAIADEDHAAFVAFVEKGKPSAAWQEFDSNALRERAWDNHRAAVIEAVTAFESLVKRLYPRVVLKQFGEGEIKQAELETLFEKAGLRTTVSVFVKLTLRRTGWSEEQIDYLYDAINLRNELIHNGRRRPDRQRAITAVSAIHKGITELEAAWGA